MPQGARPRSQMRLTREPQFTPSILHHKLRDVRPVSRYNEASIKAAFADDHERIARFKRAMEAGRVTSTSQPEQQRRRQTPPAPRPVRALLGGSRSNDGYVDQRARRGVKTGKGWVGWTFIIIVGMMMLGLVLGGLGLM
jgi:hypothetical protein